MKAAEIQDEQKAKAANRIKMQPNCIKNLERDMVGSDCSGRMVRNQLSAASRHRAILCGGLERYSASEQSEYISGANACSLGHTDGTCIGAHFQIAT